MKEKKRNTPYDRASLMLIKTLVDLHCISELESIEMICNKLYPKGYEDKCARSRHRRNLKALIK